jgi:protein-L-isoaspartate(D-aspartate) O-methyltransferase
MIQTNTQSMNFAQARFNMVEQQVRPWDVLDQRVLDVMLALAREDFVPLAYRNLAYADIEVPLGHGQAMLPPKLEGRMAQALALQDSDHVLEIGTGSAYLTALLGKLARHVCSVEIIEEFVSAGTRRLAQAGIHNVTLQHGDGARGWSSHAPYDAIVLGGSVPVLAEAFKQQLRPGGRLFAIIGVAPLMRACLITRNGEHDWFYEELFETELQALENAPPAPRFVF